MLATNEITFNSRIYKSKLSGTLGYLNQWKNINGMQTLDCTPKFQLPCTDVVCQHIYFLSNEEIKENDWCLYGNEVYRASFKLNQLVLTNKNKSFATNSIPVRKVIATTDTSLGLPQPSKEFIQAYIKAYNKPITKVLVEYDAITLNEDWSKRPVVVTNEYKLKVNYSNEITIKKVKDSWARGEVISFAAKLRWFINEGNKTVFEVDKWIEENL